MSCCGRIASIPQPLVGQGNMHHAEDHSGQMNSLGRAESDKTTIKERGGPEVQKVREYCLRCRKAKSTCICHRIPTQVENKTPIIILQHPKERDHPLGSARIALLGLQNVELVTIPKDPFGEAFSRNRAKTPGSRRSRAAANRAKLTERTSEAPSDTPTPSTTCTIPNPPTSPKHDPEEDILETSPAQAGTPGEVTSTRDPKSSPPTQVIFNPEVSSDTGPHRPFFRAIGPKGGDADGSLTPPDWIDLAPGTALLFPCEKSIDLAPLSSLHLPPAARSFARPQATASGGHGSSLGGPEGESGSNLSSSPGPEAMEPARDSASLAGPEASEMCRNKSTLAGPEGSSCLAGPKKIRQLGEHSSLAGGEAMQPTVSGLAEAPPGSIRLGQALVGGHNGLGATDSVALDEGDEAERSFGCNGGGANDADLTVEPLRLTESGGNGLMEVRELREGECRSSDFEVRGDQVMVREGGARLQLIVIDGTWSKAKRIYLENPWLRALPAYRLPERALGPSRYGYIRRQPGENCLSTLESIVQALHILEPDLQGLDTLLRAFEQMVGDQMHAISSRGKVPTKGLVAFSTKHAKKGKAVAETRELACDRVDASQLQI